MKNCMRPSEDNLIEVETFSNNSASKFVFSVLTPTKIGSQMVSNVTNNNLNK